MLVDKNAQLLSYLQCNKALGTKLGLMSKWLQYQIQQILQGKLLVGFA